MHEIRQERRYRHVHQCCHGQPRARSRTAVETAGKVVLSLSILLMEFSLSSRNNKTAPPKRGRSLLQKIAQVINEPIKSREFGPGVKLGETTAH